MEEHSQLTQFLETLLTQLPSLITLLVGTVAALMRWRRHPSVSLVLAAGLVWMLVNILAFSVVYTFVLPSFFRSSALFLRSSIQFIYTAVGFVYNFAIVIGFALLLTAVFMKRTPPAAVSAQ